MITPREVVTSKGCVKVNEGELYMSPRESIGHQKEEDSSNKNQIQKLLQEQFRRSEEGRKAYRPPSAARYEDRKIEQARDMIANRIRGIADKIAYLDLITTSSPNLSQEKLDNIFSALQKASESINSMIFQEGFKQELDIEARDRIVEEVWGKGVKWSEIVNPTVIRKLDNKE